MAGTSSSNIILLQIDLAYFAYIKYNKDILIVLFSQSFSLLAPLY